MLNSNAQVEFSITLGIIECILIIDFFILHKMDIDKDYNVKFCAKVSI